ncbi:MAG: hypothetical protein ACREER_03730 [Alphaproteobacteria bacterium]
MTAAQIGFAPLIASGLLVVLALAAAAALGFGLAHRARGLGWRGLVLAALLAVLANPSLDREERRALPDLVVLLDDQSPSLAMPERRAAADDALAAIEAELGGLTDVEVRRVAVGGASAAPPGGLPRSGTFAFEALGRALADVPTESVAGVIMVTDGQVHDAPSPETTEAAWPTHALIAGRPGEIDRRLVIDQAPTYGLVDDEIEIAVTIEDAGAPADPTPVPVTVSLDGGEPRTKLIRPGERTAVTVTLTHAGPTVIALAAQPRPGELSPLNNRAVLAINGVRERLRVLLISGEAHTGERVWRSLLKADPAVDLVHFTILRPPEKQDGTPIRELALISFPVRELFEVKLDEFDLIIFDRYRRRGIIPQGYLQNIARFVEQGGALLIAAGPDFASPLSLYNTPLGPLLPAHPSGDVVLAGFKPMLTDTGKRHPVTADLAGAAPDDPHWGRWFRIIDTVAPSGDVLMTGADDRPLLVLDHVRNGRVAQLLSDQAWLWVRGFEGGGPQAELLRRIAHWLMKEPELDENALRAEARGTTLTITRQSLDAGPATATVTGPSGTITEVALEDRGRGRKHAEVTVEEPGLYKVTSGDLLALAAVGELNPREWLDLRATDAVLRPVTAATGGALVWLAVEGMPRIRRIEAGHDRSGPGWIGLVRTRRYVVTGVDQVPLMPPWLALALALGGLALAWRAEGR